MFDPRFTNDVLDPSHPDYGCLLLDPSQKGSSIRRNSYTTMRQTSGNHPYKRDHLFKRDFMRSNNKSLTHKVSSTNLLPRHHNKEKVVSSMSLSRLLNLTSSSDKDSMCSSSDDGNGDVHPLSKAFTSDSPTTTPSPTFKVIPTFDHHHHQEWKNVSNTRLLPPIFHDNDYEMKYTESEPRITPVYSPTWSPVSPVSSESSSTDCDKDIIDTINATILLQRLSQDDGARPFKPMHPSSIPSKVMVGNQEFRICWDN